MKMQIPVVVSSDGGDETPAGPAAGRAAAKLWLVTCTVSEGDEANGRSEFVSVHATRDDAIAAADAAFAKYADPVTCWGTPHPTKPRTVVTPDASERTWHVEEIDAPADYEYMFDWWEYKGVKYPVRAVDVEGFGRETISIESLQRALEGGNGEIEEPEAVAIDENIFFYVEDQQILLPPGELAEQLHKDLT